MTTLPAWWRAKNYDDFASMMEDHAGRAGNVMPRGPSQRPPTHFGRLSLRLSQTAARDRKAAGVTERWKGTEKVPSAGGPSCQCRSGGKALKGHGRTVVSVPERWKGTEKVPSAVFYPSSEHLSLPDTITGPCCGKACLPRPTPLLRPRPSSSGSYTALASGTWPSRRGSAASCQLVSYSA